jgi:hypothetical protein
MSRPARSQLLLLVLLLTPTALLAGAVEIVLVELRRSGDEWRPDVTLRHADSGWEHYADAWRIRSSDGQVLSRRTLYHPHVDEQPFTRSGPAFVLPPGSSGVVVEAHDSVHGWSDARLEVDLAQPQGARWRILDDR